MVSYTIHQYGLLFLHMLGMCCFLLQYFVSNETNCDIICLQEKKRALYEAYLRNFCHRKYDKFSFHPSNGASGGTITIWHISKFASEPILDNEYAQMVKFWSSLANESWALINIYAPCTLSGN
jgi:exonuclease III